jgi:hypothetical protein
MDNPRCTDKSRPLADPKSRACILEGRFEEVTLDAGGKREGVKDKDGADGETRTHQQQRGVSESLIVIGGHTARTPEFVPKSFPRMKGAAL